MILINTPSSWLQESDVHYACTDWFKIDWLIDWLIDWSQEVGFTCDVERRGIYLSAAKLLQYFILSVSVTITIVIIIAGDDDGGGGCGIHCFGLVRRVAFIYLFWIIWWTDIWQHTRLRGAYQENVDVSSCGTWTQASIPSETQLIQLLLLL